MLALTFAGTFVLVALAIGCFAAYKIKARRFEFSTSVWKLASFKITVVADEGPHLTDSQDAVRNP